MNVYCLFLGNNIKRYRTFSRFRRFGLKTSLDGQTRTLCGTLAFSLAHLSAKLRLILVDAFTYLNQEHSIFPHEAILSLLCPSIDVPTWRHPFSCFAHPSLNPRPRTLGVPTWRHPFSCYAHPALNPHPRTLDILTGRHPFSRYAHTALNPRPRTLDVPTWRHPFSVMPI